MLIVCEGRETEPRYFEELLRTLGVAATVDVVIDGKTGYTDPAGLVGAAEDLRQSRMRKARRSNTLVEFEDVWVVFDVENPSNGRGPNVVPAVAKALHSRIQPAVSKPSFEVWYLLHDRSTPPGLACSDDARPHLTACLGKSYGKDGAAASAIAQWAMPRTATALKHGKRQDVFSGQENTPAAHVPASVGTSVYRLVDQLVEMSNDLAGKRMLGFITDISPARGTPAVPSGEDPV